MDEEHKPNLSAMATLLAEYLPSGRLGEMMRKTKTSVPELDKIILDVMADYNAAGIVYSSLIRAAVNFAPVHRLALLSAVMEFVGLGRFGQIDQKEMPPTAGQAAATGVPELPPGAYTMRLSALRAVGFQDTSLCVTTGTYYVCLKDHAGEFFPFLQSAVHHEDKVEVGELVRAAYDRRYPVSSYGKKAGA